MIGIIHNSKYIRVQQGFIQDPVPPKEEIQIHYFSDRIAQLQPPQSFLNSYMSVSFTTYNLCRAHLPCTRCLWPWRPGLGHRRNPPAAVRRSPPVPPPAPSAGAPSFWRRKSRLVSTPPDAKKRSSYRDNNSGTKLEKKLDSKSYLIKTKDFQNFFLRLTRMLTLLKLLFSKDRPEETDRSYGSPCFTAYLYGASCRCSHGRRLFDGGPA